MMWNGVYADSCFSFLVGFQGLIPLFRFPSLASCPFYIFRCKGFGFSLSNVLDEQTILCKISHPLWDSLPQTVGNQPRTLLKSATDFGKMSHRLWGNQPVILGKSATDFGKIGHQLWENRQPTLGKSATDFEKMSHRLWENEPPTGKSVTDFGEICHRCCEAPFLGQAGSVLGRTCSVFGKNRFLFWEKHAPFLGKNMPLFWEKTCPILGKNRLRFWEEQAPFLGQSGSVLVKTGAVWGLNWLGFWIGLDKAQVSLF